MRKNRWVAFLILNAFAAVAVGGLYSAYQNRPEPSTQVETTQSPGVVKQEVSASCSPSA